MKKTGWLHRVVCLKPFNNKVVKPSTSKLKVKNDYTLQKIGTDNQTFLNLFTNTATWNKTWKLSTVSVIQTVEVLQHKEELQSCTLQLDCLTFKSDIAVVAEEFVVSDPDFSSRAGSPKVASTGNTLYDRSLVSNSLQNTKKRKCFSKAAWIKPNKAWTTNP